MITGFQFRAILAITNTEINQLAEILNIHSTTLLRYKKASNLQLIPAHNKNSQLIVKYFTQQGFNFDKVNTITLVEKENYVSSSHYLNRFQLVCGRIATLLTQKEFAQIIGVSPSAISIFERLKNQAPINTRKLKNRNLKIFFAHLGIIFNNTLSVTLEKDPPIILKNAN